MNTQPIGPFLGVNNRLPDFALHVDQKGDFLRDAVDVDVDNAGRLRRRAGRTMVQALTGPHSKFELDGRHFLVRNGVLYRVTITPYTESMLKLLSTDDRMAYVTYNGDIYCSNGTDALRIAADNTVYPWAMATPAQPTVVTISGSLPAGWYQVGVTYSNSVTGEESGCAGTTNHQLTVAGALRVTLPGASPGATHVNVYVSRTNGAEPGRYASVAIGTGTVDITSLTITTTLQTAYLEPLPAGTRLFTHMGRLCVVSGAYLYYSDPYRLGYGQPLNYVQFETDISIALSAQSGVFVAADKTRWIPGDINAVQDMVVDVLQYGAVPGTEFVVPHNSKVGWFGAKGFVVGSPSGEVEAVMTDNVDQTPPASGVAAVFQDRGYRRVLACGWCMNLESYAVTRYDNSSFTSVYGDYATLVDGLYLLAGSTDNGDEIVSKIALGKQDFGSESLKYLPAVYVGVSSEAAMQLEVQYVDETDTAQDFTYATRGFSPAMQIQRFDTGRGIKANWFDLTIYNDAGADFTLASVSFVPVASTRRI